MARDKTIKFIRTLKNDLDSEAGLGNLIIGEPYFITDTSQVAIGTSTTTYQITGPGLLNTVTYSTPTTLAAATVLEGATGHVTSNERDYIYLNSKWRDLTKLTPLSDVTTDTDCRLCIRGDDNTATIGTSVTTMSDTSPNGYTLTKGSGTSPTIQWSGSHRYFDFGTSGCNFTASSQVIPDASDVFLFLVWKPNSTPTGSEAFYLMYDTQQATDTERIIPTPSASTYPNRVGYYDQLSGGWVAESTASFSTTGPYKLMAMKLRDSQAKLVYVNNSLVLTGTDFNALTRRWGSTYYFSNNLASSFANMKGRIMEFRIYKTLSDSKFNDISDELMTYYAL